MNWITDAYSKRLLMLSLQVQSVVKEIENEIHTKHDPQILVGLVKEGTLTLREMRKSFRQMVAGKLPKCVIENCRQLLRRNQQCFYSVKKKLMAEYSHSVRHRIPASVEPKTTTEKNMPMGIAPHKVIKNAIKDSKVIARGKRFLNYWGPLAELGSNASALAETIEWETELELTTVLR